MTVSGAASERTTFPVGFPHGSVLEPVCGLVSSLICLVHNANILHQLVSPMPFAAGIVFYFLMGKLSPGYHVGNLRPLGDN